MGEVTNKQAMCTQAVHLLIVAIIVSLLFFADGQEANGCRCGLTSLQSRIIGGDQAQQGEFPWQVALTTNEFFQFCGGTLINDRWVLTAAHCVYNKDPSGVRVVLSTNDLMQAQVRSLDVSKIVVYPGYTGPPDQLFDLALIELSRNVRLSNVVTPVCLPERSMVMFSNLNAVGWGATVNKGRGVRMLKHVSLRQRSQQECTRMYGPQRFTQNHVCANDVGKDVCNGDSGGPLTTVSNGVTHIVGVVSWGVVCGRYQFPSVFTRVSSYVDWILAEASQGANWCSSAESGQ